MRQTAMPASRLLGGLLPALACAVLLGACGPAVTKPGDSASSAGAPSESAPAMSTTAPMATRGPCDASKAQSFVGQKASADVQEQARSASGAGTARTLQPGQPITKEFNGERLNLHVDAAGNIVSVNCG